MPLFEVPTTFQVAINYDYKTAIDRICVEALILQ